MAHALLFVCASEFGFTQASTQQCCIPWLGTCLLNRVIGELGVWELSLLVSGARRSAKCGNSMEKVSIRGWLSRESGLGQSRGFLLSTTHTRAWSYTTILVGSNLSRCLVDISFNLSDIGGTAIQMVSMAGRRAKAFQQRQTVTELIHVASLNMVYCSATTSLAIVLHAHSLLRFWW